MNSLDLDTFEQGDTRGPIVDLKRIRQFVVLAETLNFRRAAERLHMAQPPLSVSIQKLESELGVRLFERGGAGGVSLTPIGHLALQEAKKLLFYSTQFRETIKMASQGLGGNLRIGFVGSTTNGVLQRIVRLFRAEYPGISLLLSEGSTVQIIEKIDAGTLDAGLVRTPVLVSAQVKLTPILTEEFIVAIPKGSPLAAYPVLKMSELANEAFVFYSGAGSSGLHAMAILACQEAGFLPRIVQSAAQVQTILSMVESGLGIALVPAITENIPNPRIAYRKISDISENSRIGVSLAVHASNPAPALFHFIDSSIHAFGHNHGNPLFGRVAN